MGVDPLNRQGDMALLGLTRDPRGLDLTYLRPDVCVED